MREPFQEIPKKDPTLRVTFVKRGELLSAANRPSLGDQASKRLRVLVEAVSRKRKEKHIETTPRGGDKVKEVEGE